MVLLVSFYFIETNTIRMIKNNNLNFFPGFDLVKMPLLFNTELQKLEKDFQSKSQWWITRNVSTQLNVFRARVNWF